MTPEVCGPSMGHFLAEISRSVEGWDRLTPEQSDALLGHLTFYLETINPRYDPTGLR